MRSLVLRAGTVAGVVAVLALPTAAAHATTSTTSTTTTASASAAATTGRIVSGEALAAAMAVPAPAHAGSDGPVVHRRPLGPTPTMASGAAS